MTMHLDVRLVASFPEKRFGSKVPWWCVLRFPTLCRGRGDLLSFRIVGWLPRVRRRSLAVCAAGGELPSPKRAFLGKAGLRKLAAGRRGCGRGAHSRVPQVDRLTHRAVMLIKRRSASCLTLASSPSGCPLRARSIWIERPKHSSRERRSRPAVPLSGCESAFDRTVGAGLPPRNFQAENNRQRLGHFGSRDDIWKRLVFLEGDSI
jgi:hypothetical protein